MRITGGLIFIIIMLLQAALPIGIDYTVAVRDVLDYKRVFNLFMDGPCICWLMDVVQWQNNGKYKP